MNKTFHTLINEINSTINIESQYSEAENFYSRLFNLLYNWKHLENLNYTSKNYPGIDLYEKQEKIGIQVTALTTKYLSEARNKLINSLQTFLKQSESNRKPIESFICFFINDSSAVKNLKESNIIKELESELDKSIEIKSTDSLVNDFAQLTSKDTRNYLEEFLNAEINKQSSGLYDIKIFTRVLNSDSNTLHFTPTEKTWFNSFEKLFEQGNKEFLISGPPCTGKSTLAKSLANHLRDGYHVFELNLNDPDLNSNYETLFSDLKQIGFYYSILILDDIHVNLKLFLRIRTYIDRLEWTKAIFVTRETFNSNFTLKEILHRISLSSSELGKSKILGIIENRISRFDRNRKWEIGDKKKIFEKYQNNLLVLDYSLTYWKTKKGEIAFSDLTETEILEDFYINQDLQSVESKTLLLASFLGSLDMPANSIYLDKSELLIILEKGILSKYNLSKYLKIKHEQYAASIYKAIKENSFENFSQELEYFLDYVNNCMSGEINYVFKIIQKLENKKSEFLPPLINSLIDNKNLTLIINHISHQNVRYSLLPLLSQCDIKSELSTHVEEMIKNILEKNPLKLYDNRDYLIKHNLIHLKGWNWIDKFTDSKSVKNQNRNKHVTKVAHAISLKATEENGTHKLLNIYDFPTWYTKINELRAINQISMVLSDLNKSVDSKILLTEILKHINLENLIQKTIHNEADKISIGLREFQSIDETFGTSISLKIWENRKVKEAVRKSCNKANISSIVKCLSELRFIDKEFSIRLTNELYENDVFLKALKKEKSLTKIIHSIQELFVHDTLKELIIHQILSFINDGHFLKIINRSNNTDHLKLVSRLINNQKFNLKNRISEKELSKLLSHINSVQNSREVNINPELIIQFIRQNRTTKLKDFIDEIYKRDALNTIKSFSEINQNLFIESLSRHHLRINQSTELLLRMKSRLKKSKTINCDEIIASLLEKTIQHYKQPKYQKKKLEFTLFVTAFTFALKIDKEICKNQLESEFIARMNSQYQGCKSLGQLLQMISRILFLDSSLDFPT